LVRGAGTARLPEDLLQPGCARGEIEPPFALPQIEPGQDRLRDRFGGVDDKVCPALAEGHVEIGLAETTITEGHRRTPLGCALCAKLARERKPPDLQCKNAPKAIFEAGFAETERQRRISGAI
jgi:hypothetical protein